MSEKKLQQHEVEIVVSKAVHVPSGMGMFEFTGLICEAAVASIKAAGKAPTDDNYPGYVVEIYEDSLIFKVYGNGDMSGGHFRASWKVSEGKVEIGEWRQVIEVTNYVEVRKSRWQTPGLFDNLF